MLPPLPRQGVAYVIDATERPGMVHSIAAVFAHRGLSMDALVADTNRSDPRIVVLFHGTPRQCRMVAHVLPRLHDVRRVQVLPLDSPLLRAVVLCDVDGPLPPLAEVDVHEVSGHLLLLGRYQAVDDALQPLRERQTVRELSRTVIAT